MRYAEVAVDSPTVRGPATFTYEFPSSLELDVGHLVWVPFGSRHLIGIVVELSGTPPPFETRAVRMALLETPVISSLQVSLARWISSYYRCPLFEALSLMLQPGLLRNLSIIVRPSVDSSEESIPTEEGRQLWCLIRAKKRPTSVAVLTKQLGPRKVGGGLRLLLQRGLITLEPRWAAPRAAPAGRPAGEEATASALLPAAGGLPAGAQKPELTVLQRVAAAPIIECVQESRHEVFLLWGVTGSGKTHVYLEAVEAAVSDGKQAVLLVSEISLTPEAVHRVSERFPGQVAVLHSRLPLREHLAQWKRVAEGHACVVVGSRSAVFAPVRRLGIVAVDEEHEWSYKQEHSPRYHAREAAIELGRLAGAPVVLGSATPDVVSFALARARKYHLLNLPWRYVPPVSQEGSQTVAPGSSARALPAVEVVDMRDELRAGNRGLFSRILQSRLREACEAKEQVILFLNRRGAATAVTCVNCGYTAKCRRCETPVIYHESLRELVCHRCNGRKPLLAQCPGCGERRLRFVGAGTERVEAEVRRLLPEVRVLRWDRDVTGPAGAHLRIWEAFGRREADVLVGTQMVAKALDFPAVTLVGVIMADTGLNLPDFRAAERTFQLLTQVAGRAGRGPSGGHVIIQTFAPQHYVVQAASRHDYEAFFEREMEFRRRHGYPPFSRLAKLVFAASNERECWRESARVRRLLDEEIEVQGLTDLRVIGPAPGFQSKVRGRYRWQLLLCGDSFERVLDRASLSPAWTVDIDPVTLL